MFFFFLTGMNQPQEAGWGWVFAPLNAWEMGNAWERRVPALLQVLSCLCIVTTFFISVE